MAVPKKILLVDREPGVTRIIRRALERGDIVGLAVAAVVIGGILYGYVELAHLWRPARSDFGFGPGWACTDPGHGEPVCVKQASSKK